jgi:hypothetical protein
MMIAQAQNDPSKERTRTKMKITGKSYIAKIQVSTTAYRFAHGKRPTGRGYWAFSFRDADSQDTIAFFTKAASGIQRGDDLYSEAKKWAIAHAARLNAVRVEICP